MDELLRGLRVRINPSGCWFMQLKDTICCSLCDDCSQWRNDGVAAASSGRGPPTSGAARGEGGSFPMGER